MHCERGLRVRPRPSLTASIAARHRHQSAALARHPGECIYGWRVGTSVAGLAVDATVRGARRVWQQAITGAERGVNGFPGRPKRWLLAYLSRFQGPQVLSGVLAKHSVWESLGRVAAVLMPRVGTVNAVVLTA